MANTRFRAGRRIKTHLQQVPKACHPSAEHRRPHCKQDKRSLLSEAIVILLKKTHGTFAQRLVLPDYQQSGFSLSRKHGLATFVYERLKCTLFDQSPPTSETEWLCVNVDGYKIVNVYKPPPIRFQVYDIPVFPHLCLYAGNFNCQYVDWGYDTNRADGECLVGWANTNNLALLHNSKDATSFHSGRSITSTNPDLAFVTIDLDSRLPDRYVLEKFQWSQHRPSPITPPRFAHPVPSKPVKRWNFRKAKWSHYITLTNKLARTFPPPVSPDMDQAYQCFHNAIGTAAKSTSHVADEIIVYHVGMSSVKTSTKHFCNTPKGMNLAELLQFCLPGLTGNRGIDDLRLSRTLTFYTPAG